MNRRSLSLSGNPYYYFLIILSVAVSLQFGYFFEGSERYIPYRTVFLVFIVLICYMFLLKHVLSMNTILMTLLVSAISFLFLMVLSEDINKKLLVGTVNNFSYIILFYFVLSVCFEKTALNQVERAFAIGLKLFSLALLVDTIFRFKYPMFSISGDKNLEFVESVIANEYSLYSFFKSGAFYAYKYSSIMFYDSNYVGLHALALVVFFGFYQSVFKKNMTLWVLLNFFIVLFSFSRSAVLVLIFYFLIKFYVDLFLNKKYLLIFFITIINTLLAFIAAYYIYYYIIADDSFGTKIGIMSSLLSVIDKPLINIFFGFGIIEGGYVYSYIEGGYAHSLYPILLGQFGVVGLIIYFVFILGMGLKAGRYGIYLIITIFMAGFSLVSPWQIIYFWGLLYMADILRKVKLERY